MRLQGNGATSVHRIGTPANARSVRKRRIASIFQHYYPEGGWGYIVLICGFFVQLISNGFQEVFGILMVIISTRLHISSPAKIGKMILDAVWLCAELFDFTLR